MKKLFDSMMAVLTLIALFISSWCCYISFNIPNIRLGFTYFFLSFGLMLFVYSDYKNIIKGEVDESPRT